MPCTTGCCRAESNLTQRLFGAMQRRDRAATAGTAVCLVPAALQKTSVVYCRDANPGDYPERSFEFLGYTFRPRASRSRNGKCFVSFLSAVSSSAAKGMRRRVRRWRLHSRNDLELQDIAAWARPVLVGWVRYYGRFYPSKLREESHDSFSSFVTETCEEG